MSLRSQVLWRVAPRVLRAVGKALFSLQVEQEAHPPNPPFVVAANHYSHFDSPAIGAALDLPVRYLALENIFGVSRLLDWLIIGFGAIPTPRDRRPVGAVRTALAALGEGEVVGVFPEGTRVSHWGTLSPKRGAGWLATTAGVPLLPVAVVGSGRVLGLENRLRRGPIRVVIGEALQPGAGGADELTRAWSEWVGAQIGRYPSSEVSGPRRAHIGGS